MTRAPWRRDWWRFWAASTRGPASYLRGAASVTVRLGVRELTVGYRRKGYRA